MGQRPCFMDAQDLLSTLRRVCMQYGLVVWCIMPGSIAIKNAWVQSRICLLLKILIHGACFHCGPTRPKHQRRWMSGQIGGRVGGQIGGRVGGWGGPTWCIRLVVGVGGSSHLELALAVTSAPHGPGIARVIGHRSRLVPPAV